MSGSRLTSLVGRGSLYARTLAHLHPLQVAFRPVHAARTAALRRSPQLASMLAGSGEAQFNSPLLPVQGTLSTELPGIAPELERATQALAGSIHLVGRAVRIAPPATDFELAVEPRLVRYQMAYLGAARSLAVAARTAGFEARAAALAVAHLREFVERVPPGHGDAWDPYPTAIRLLNAVVSRDLLRPIVSDDDAHFLDQALPCALAQHARWLTATLELHLLGNHLFSDGAALFVAGCALRTRESGTWRGIGRAILERSLTMDVLSDGGHAERSPMYAAIYLDQLELAIAAARSQGLAVPRGSLEAARTMARQLLAIAHPDSDIPLLGDSAFDEAPLPSDVAAPVGLVAESLRSRLYGVLAPAADSSSAQISYQAFPETGFHVIRESGEMLVVDAGPLGTVDQPGHSHSDALTFELSRRGRRLIVDGGAGHYESDAARAYFRGPLAHNSISVAGQGSDEVWSSFRAGRRASVRRIIHEQLGTLHILRGELTAAWGWKQERLFFYAPGHLLCVFDRVVGAGDEARVESHLHFAPEVMVRLEEFAGQVSHDARPIRLVRLLGKGWALHRGERDPWRGFTSYRMGEFEPSCEVAIEALSAGQLSLTGYALVFEGNSEVIPTAAGAEIRHGGKVVRVGTDGPGLRWELQ